MRFAGYQKQCSGLKKVVGERGSSCVNGVVPCSRLLLSERVVAGGTGNDQSQEQAVGLKYR